MTPRWCILAVVLTAALAGACVPSEARSPNDDEDDAGAPGTSWPPTLVDQAPPAPPPPPRFGRY